MLLNAKQTWAGKTGCPASWSAKNAIYQITWIFFFPPLKIFNRTVVEVQLCSEQSGFQQDTNVINASVVDGTGKIQSAWLAPSQPISVLGSVCMRSLLQIEELH